MTLLEIGSLAFEALLVGAIVIHAAGLLTVLVIEAWRGGPRR